jgi:hypothetical protein
LGHLLPLHFAPCALCLAPTPNQSRGIHSHPQKQKHLHRL